MRTVILCALLGATFALPEMKLEVGTKATSHLQKLEIATKTMTYNEQVEEVNKVVDALMVEAAQYMIDEGLDPMELEDVHKGFSFKPIIIEYHGELDLTNGWLQDASTIYRSGDTSLKENSDNLTTFTVQVGFKDFLFDYHYSAKIMNLGPSGEMDGKVTNVKLLISVDVDFLNRQIYLKKFTIQDVGKITVKWHGNVLVDWLANILTSITTTLFKGIISFFAQNILKGRLIEVIEHINEVWPNDNSPVFNGFYN